MSAWMQMATGGHYNASANQAWRDNFNGGWAAGDWTGNHNAQIAADRADAGERNPEVLAHLPADYRLNPNPASPNPNRGGSVGQGASPSQSGKPGGSVGPSQSGKPGAGGPVVRVEPSVAQAGGKFKPTAGVGQITGDAGYWINKIKKDYNTMMGGGSAAHPMVDKPMEHEQVIIGGWKILHDPGWSPVEAVEGAWGEGDGITSATFWYQPAKFLADVSYTLKHHGYPGLDEGVEWLTRVPHEAGKNIRQQALDWIEENKESQPVDWNPYSDLPPEFRPYN